MESETSDDRSDEQRNKSMHLSTLNEVKKLKKLHVTQATSTTNAICPVACDIQSVTMSMSTSDVKFAPAESISMSRQNLRLSTRESLECQFSSIDPKSDRVSTILVWQNLIVKTREDKRKELFQRFRFYKNFEPKRKVLLHNLSGAITGGLWAVMGKSLVSLFNIQLDSHRTIRFGKINSLEYISMSFGCQYNC